MTSTFRTTRRTREQLRREIPGTAAVLADPHDFATMRRYRTFPFDDHTRYLRHLEDHLRTRTAKGVRTTLTLFDPDAYAEYCQELGLDPDTTDSRARYTAELACTGATVPYAGEPLAELLPLLVEETGRQIAWDRAATRLAEAGTCPDCDEDLSHTAFALATQALKELLDGLGDGTHHLVCSIPAGAPPLLAALRITSEEGRHHLSESESLTFCTVLAAGIAHRTPGGIVSRSTRPQPQPDDGTATPHDTVRGWTLRDGWPEPLTAAQVFTAYCTDAETGEPIPPEHQVDHTAGFPLTRPPETHRC
ncbi:hypothetical protein OG422_02675 [Streptomyces sp. NBC_01525]|uniref:Uncharacterized protein n=1 Tax=Streptomyces benahoarensis TaxID=2595054 RepID=A0A553YKW7_9ACTN|nr:hypothetical protein [Streptomyces benahoarensis]TSB18612.1 hypothetical protein FNJ62_23900 [Streptomyces benahoarensis]TSB29820.1 hypothetical protein FNZ23_26280 [Streptomyces benahoarensis]